MNFTGLPLTSTFIHLPGISLRRERELWKKGILNWHQLQGAVSVGKLSSGLSVIRPKSAAIVDRPERYLVPFALSKGFGRAVIGYGRQTHRIVDCGEVGWLFLPLATPFRKVFSLLFESLHPLS
jgi:hypothetical protein